MPRKPEPEPQPPHPMPESLKARKRQSKVPAWTLLPPLLACMAVAFYAGKIVVLAPAERDAAVRSARSEAFVAGWREAKMADWTSTVGADVLYQDEAAWLGEAGIDVWREDPALVVRLAEARRLWLQERQP